MQQGLLERLPSLGRPRILVLGDVMLDRDRSVCPDGVAADAASLIAREQRIDQHPGGAAFVASLLSHLEARSTVIAVIGDDEEGRLLERQLREGGVEAVFVRDPSRPTTVKERVLVPGAGGPQTLFRIDRESTQAVEPTFAERIITAVIEKLADCDALVVSDYAKGGCPRAVTQTVIAAARQLGRPVVVDPSSVGRFCRYRGCTVIAPSRAETAPFVGRRTLTAHEALAAGRRICSELDVDAAAITLDCEGTVLCTADGATTVFGSRADAVVDVVGAGDAVTAVLALCLAEGVEITTAVELGNLAGGLLVERCGTAPFRRGELLAKLSRSRFDTAQTNPKRGTCYKHSLTDPSHRASLQPGSPGPSAEVSVAEAASFGGGIPASVRQAGSLPYGGEGSYAHSPAVATKAPDLSTLQHLLNEYRQRGLRIVLTNGCFDLLHAGHVTYLQQAAAEGDCLIVAVNSDHSIRRLKGTNRPVYSEAERLRMLASLEAVDYVITFDEPTPHHLIAAIRPDLLVKGGDYTRQGVVGRELVEAYGGTVKTLGHIPGLSTSDILARATAAANADLQATDAGPLSEAG